MSTIDALPDIVSLRRIQTALWREGEGQGAAVMVGAGVSRAARRAAGDAPLPPLWKDLGDEMRHVLYPKGGAPDDPLRLAQEYECI
jgi:hypothetical protein